jgi:Tol biopolymer transport system component
MDRGTPPAAELWVVEIESGMRMKITDGAGADFNPVWAANGRVYFVSSRAGTENIWSLTTHVTGYARASGVDTRYSRADTDVTEAVTED